MYPGALRAITIVLILKLSIIVCIDEEYVEFPEDFRFGVASASYQVEGGWNAGDKGESIWDRFSHKKPSPIKDGSTGDIACDSYHKYKEDVKMLRDLGVSFYRFSISWPRVLPRGTTTLISRDGISYYNNLIDELLKYNITPFVTMYHWDLPQVLQDIGGWTNPMIVDYFEAYAKVLFQAFGDKVKWWTTVNEPNMICNAGYTTVSYAPGLQLHGIGDYLCNHHLLLANARAWHLYNNMFRKTQKGRVGLTIYCPWVEPESNSTVDKDISDTALQFLVGLHAHPIFSSTGDYPDHVKTMVGIKSVKQGFPSSRLPAFTEDQLKMVKGSADFLGLNHYTTMIYTRNRESNFHKPSMEDDLGFVEYQKEEWPGGASSWLKIYPPGLRSILNWIKDEYNNPEVVITENGYSSRGGLRDMVRVQYIKDHVVQVRKAMLDGCNVTGYTSWTLMDNYEWVQGYTECFGIYEVDFKSPNRTRKPRLSAYMYKDIIMNNAVNMSYTPDASLVSSGKLVSSTVTIITLAAILVSLNAILSC